MAITIPDQGQALLTDRLVAVEPQVVRCSLTTVSGYFSGGQAARVFGAVIDGVNAQAQATGCAIPTQLAGQAVGFCAAVTAVAIQLSVVIGQ